MTESPADEKRRIRAAVRRSRNARAAQDAAHREIDRDRLTAQLVALVEDLDARVVSCYLPTPGEPDTTGFIAWARDHNVDVLLPVALSEYRLAWARLGDAGTAPGLHGLAEPIGPRLPAEALAGADLLLIPASAVDVSGTRMGWGLGYFDRALATLAPRPPVFAVVHENEILPRVPSDAHDVPVTGAVTSAGIRRFPTGPG
ncbi:5-formyltetrahydrofolate cyclo-ligase [Leucobacter rhizosphaerae]|uniref:5-formyltetrahydrofolate cyclo-ligase n=1 Tax=Leucobacter rhizosphaerae TaxID=2932245 RepID=A0ABY4FUR8_9MICO|nr:5-formyltetrahydrofolate cyclo-ligase [Leucobacter rhizosphaerae]UOQ59986.1 5-formyltetrahydrofolate cyclo-ligase [Leucobacter rhizosphaerae]